RFTVQITCGSGLFRGPAKYRTVKRRERRTPRCSTATSRLGKAATSRRAPKLAPACDLRHVLLFLFVGGVEGVLQGYEVFTRLQRIEQHLLGLELFVRVVGGLDGEADAAVALVDLDDAG